MSSTTYGLQAVGLNFTSATKLRAMASGQMRAIAKLPAHITHVSNDSVRKLFRTQDVILTLREQAEEKTAGAEDTSGARC